MILTCKRCGIVVCKNVQLGKRINSESSDGPIVGNGEYIKIVDENKYTNYVAINRTDLVNTIDHPDGLRWTGCCGPDGDHGENVLCQNGHEIGVVFQDCWTYHCFVATQCIEKLA